MRPPRWLAKLDWLADLYGRWFMFKLTLSLSVMVLIGVAAGVIALAKGCAR